MQEYQSIKKVHATAATSTHWMSWRQKLKAGTYNTTDLDGNLAGYIVCYNRQDTEKEYWSWSPKDVFESGYDSIPKPEPRLKTVAKFA